MNIYTIEYILENNIDKTAYGFIYITTNLINGKKYIGQKKFREGWKIYLGSGIAIKQAIKKYGKENFKKVIISIANSIEDLNILEIKYITNRNAVEDVNYYNIARGGDIFCVAGIKIVCINDGKIYNSIADACHYYSKSRTYIIGTYKKKHTVENYKDTLIFRIFNQTKKNQMWCGVCAKKIIRKSNCQKMCPICANKVNKEKSKLRQKLTRVI